MNVLIVIVDAKSRHDYTFTACLYWRLKVTTAFYNREAQREPKVHNSEALLPFCPIPTYESTRILG